MSDKILLVDDDPNLLAAQTRNLRRQFEIETAEGGELGLAKIRDSGPYAVVVADRQMPGMDGIELLSRVRQAAPDTIRMMLTGNADLEAAIRVVNEGNIFRFLTKPCPTAILSKALTDALEQYRLVTAEKELLNKTLGGSIKLLTDILSTVDSASFGRAQAMRDSINSIAGKLQLPNPWELHLAVMLAPIGNVTIPPDVLLKSRAGLPLSEIEEQMIQRVPQTAARLLANIPRLEGVARIVQYQQKNFDGSGLPQDAVCGDAIPVGARLLKILLDIMQLQSRGLALVETLNELHSRQGHYDPTLLAAVRAANEGRAVKPEAEELSAEVALRELFPGMVLRSNVEANDGTLILSAGHRLTEMTLEKLHNFASLVGVKEPIIVESRAAARIT
jgi:response regulator RpfG family c-di-GMP phosphodiesterase